MTLKKGKIFKMSSLKHLCQVLRKHGVWINVDSRGFEYILFHFQVKVQCNES